MNEIQIKYENNQMLVTSVQVAKHFGKRHDKLIAEIERMYGELNEYESPLNGGHPMFTRTTYVHEQNKQEYPMYLMNRDGFSLLVMGFNNTRDVLDWKLKYIDAFNQMEKKLNDPEFLVQRSMEYLKTKCDALLLENQQMKPKVVFADAVATSEESILVGQLAKLIKQNGYDIGQNKLFEWLREHNYLIKSGARRNQPTQRSMEMKLFEVKERAVANPDGSTRLTLTTKVTGKGQVYFVNKFLNKEA